MRIIRHHFFLICISLLPATGLFAQEQSWTDQIKSVIQGKKATVGVAVIADNETLTINNEAHYPTLSVFKFPLALAVLDHMDKNGSPLETEIFVSQADLLRDTYSPLRDRFPKGNFNMSVGDLLKYSVSLSDNNACDILFRYVGGPATVEKYIKSLGISDIAITADEEMMHREFGNQRLNQTTPYGMAQLLEIFLKKDLFAPAYKEFLKTIMIGTSTGPDKLKGMFPDSIIVGHKTGSSDRNRSGLKIADNDVGFVYLPDGKPYFIAVLVMDSMESDQTNASIIARISKITYDYLCKK